MDMKSAIAIITNMIPKKCKLVNGVRRDGYDDWESVEGKAISVAIKVFEEVEQYQTLGTVEECRVAVEKQRAMEKAEPRKPIIHTDTNRADCPICGAIVRGIDKPFGNWCSKCGQKLDWGEEE